MNKLLIITSRYPHLQDKISATYVYNQVDIIKNYFKEVVVISTTPFTPKIFTPILPSQRKLDSLAKNYSYDNVRVYFTKNIVPPINFFKKTRGIQGLNSVKRILSKINFKPDLIHAHRTWPSGYIAVRLKEEIEKPVIITIHENHDWLIEEMKEKKLQDVWKKANTLIRVNQRDLDLLRKYNDDIYYIPNGYNESKFRPLNKITCRQRLKISTTKKIFFSLGEITNRKGFQNILKVIKTISNKNFKFYIGGNGPLREKLIKKIEKNNIKNFIEFIGYIPDDLVHIWMNACDVFVLPSYSEGNPTVMFEALACGKPFIGTNVGGVPDIIKNEELGILTSPGNIKELSNALRYSMEKEWDSDYIRQYSQQFTWTKISNNIIKLYNKLY